MTFTSAQQAASWLTLIGLGLLSLVFAFDAYRSFLHVCSIATLLTALWLWSCIRRARPDDNHRRGVSP